MIEVRGSGRYHGAFRYCLKGQLDRPAPMSPEEAFEMARRAMREMREGGGK